MMKVRFLVLWIFLFGLSWVWSASVWPASKPDIIEAPFRFLNNELLLEVRIDGKGPYSMLLDTGADPSAIDLKTARELRLKLGQKGQVASGGTAVHYAYEVQLASVAVGEFSATDIHAAALEGDVFFTTFGASIHGVLGHSFLDQRVIQIDYPKRVVRFFRQSPIGGTGSPIAPGSARLSFRDRKVLIDDVDVNGLKTTACLDTGSNGNFQLMPQTIARLSLEKTLKGALVASATGFNGDFEIRSGRIQGVRVGTIPVESPLVEFLQQDTGWDEHPCGVSIGNRFLKDYVLTLDYPRKTILLERP